MIKNVYTLHDDEFGVYGENVVISPLDPESYVSELAMALRGGSANPQVKACTIYHIGTYDSKTGALVSTTPMAIGRIRDLLRRIQLEENDAKEEE